MKENQYGISCDLQNCGRDVDPLASEMDGTALFRNTPELEYPMAVDDLSKADENETRDSVTPYTNPSSIVKLLESGTEVYADKNVMECEEPKLIICYKESAYHVVRDIWIDEGVPSEDKLLIKNAKDGHEGNFIIQPSNGDKNVDIDDENFKPCTGDKIGDITKERISIGLIENAKDERKSNCMFPPSNGDKNFDLDEGVPSEANILIENGKDEQKGHSIFKPCNGDKGNEVTQLSSQFQAPSEELISESPALASSTEEPNNCIPLCAITFDCNSTEPSNVDHERPKEPQNVITHDDVISDTSSISSQVHHFLGESSFSAADTVSGLITFSGPIAFSGSLSLRSDSSTTSTRSFAFPVLQSEWNSSPVRMAKADRRQFRKHRGWSWRQGLFCCRF